MSGNTCRYDPHGPEKVILGLKDKKGEGRNAPVSPEEAEEIIEKLKSRLVVRISADGEHYIHVPTGTKLGSVRNLIHFQRGWEMALESTADSE